jgi:hypothetical protein
MDAALNGPAPKWGGSESGADGGGGKGGEAARVIEVIAARNGAAGPV